MITTPEQTEIDSLKSELVNLRSDITISNNVLRGQQESIVQAKKENDSLSETKEALSKDVAGLELKRDQLRIEVAEGTKSINNARAEHKIILAEQSASKTLLEAQKKDLSDKQAKYNDDKQELDKQLKQIAEDSALLQKKHSILSEAIKASGDLSTI